MEFPGFSFYLLGALYCVAIYNAVNVLFDRRSPAATTGWLLALLGLPWIGIPLYYLIGQSRLRGNIRKKRTRTKRFAAYAQEFERRFRQINAAPPTPPPALQVVFDRFTRIFRGIGAVAEPYLNNIALLADGEKTFAHIFAAIENAERYIFVQYYILRSDRLGLELKDLLINKAKRGIPVYVLFDDMGSFWLSKQYIRDLRDAGIQVASFLPVTKMRRGVQLNFRNHRKLVVVDGQVAFTGGLNVGDEYAGSSKIPHWRDTHVMVMGPAVAQLEEVFFEDWFFAADSRVSVKQMMRLVEQRSDTDGDLLRKTFFVLGPGPTQTNRSHQALVQVIPSGPSDDMYLNALLFVELINSSRHRLWIASPYFVPDATLELALELAILRGVDVRILIPKESDHRIVQWVSMHHAMHFKRQGAEVFLYRRGFMHQKVLLVDEIITCIGTTNFDNRAMYLNFETSLVIHDEIFNSEVATMLEGDFGSSLRLQLDDIKGEGPLVKLRGNIARLLSPLL